jgi:uncharacterized repeat protein (TIGR02543 family)
MATKPVGSDVWSTPEFITPMDVDSSNHAISGDSTGNLVLVWYETTDEYSLRATVKPSGEDWSEPIVIGEGDSYSIGDIGLVTDSAGNSTVVWAAYTGGVDVLQTAELSSDGVWSDTETLGDGRRFNNARVVIATDGTITLVYKRTDGANDRIESMTRTFGGSWSAPTVLSEAGADSSNPGITIDAYNNVTVSWQRNTETVPHLQATTKSALGEWGEVENVCTTFEGISDPELISDPAGNLTAMWVGYRDGSQWHVGTSTKPLGGTWSTPTAFTPSDVDAGTFRLASSASGEILAMWISNVEGLKEIKYSTKNPDEDWSSAETIGSTREQIDFFRLARTANGAATVMWTQYQNLGDDKKVMLANFDMSYTIDFDSNGGLGTAPNAQVYSTNEPGVTLPNASGLINAGYRFTGWNTSADGNGDSFSAGTSFAPFSDMTLYAQWEVGSDLAETGSDVSSPLGIAVFVFAVGVALVIVRRVRQ